ncbi:MAG: GIY-YIG nuclease family protein [Endomicrobiia bacterium]
MIDFKNIPKLPGVYLMRDVKGDIVYIGKAKNLNNRIKSYFLDAKDVRPITTMFFNIKEIDYVICNTEQDALFLEQKLITNLQPKYNIFWKDNKSYPFLEITYSDKFPKVNFYRNSKNQSFHKKNKYFGPYPSSRILGYLINWARKFFHIRQCNFDSNNFPYKDDLEKKKYESCVYYQTKQCFAPCLNKISKKNYRVNIDNLILFLRGQWKKLVEVLKKQMMIFSERKDFEKAIILREIIKYVTNIQNRMITRRIDEKSLVFHTISKIDVLKKLQSKFCLKFLPVIIEAVDISTFAGTNSVGSVVRFVNGEPDKNSYRRYKIKTIFGQNDFAMLQEVVFRRYFRLLSEKKQLPQLLLIDGGKGQLNVVRETIEKLGFLDKIDLVALSKSNEDEIHLLNIKHSVKLNNSEEDNLLRYVRDEAHRFAVSYHKKLASKTLFKD